MKMKSKFNDKIKILGVANCLISAVMGIIGTTLKNQECVIFGAIIMMISCLILYSNKTEKSDRQAYEKRAKIIEEVLETSCNAIFVHRNLRFVYVNTSGAELLGKKSGDELTGEKIEDYLKINIEIIGEEIYTTAKECGFIDSYTEDTFYKANGEEIKMKILISTMVIDDENYIRVVCKNVPENKKIIELEEKVQIEAEKLKAKIESERIKDEFFANLSHELRTPLTIILGSIQLIEKNDKYMIQSDDRSFRSLKNNGFRLLRLVNNLLDITKIDAGYFEISKRKNNIVYLVEDIVGSVGDYVKSKGIQIQFDTEIEEKVVECNEESIDRILLNLLSNAVKFTPEGGSIFVDIFDKGDTVQIRFKDTGIGIKEEDQKCIFKRFRQVDKSFRRNHEGSGIGLSIVKSLVEMHDGDIKMKSEYGKGTEFIVELPTVVGELYNESLEILDKEKYIEHKVNIEFSDV